MSRIAESAYGDLPYPQSPGYKTDGTSREAAHKVAGNAKSLRERVFAEIAAAGARGLTADEVATRLGRTILGVRPRVSELKKAGRIVETGERRPNDSGIDADVMRAK